MPSRILFLSSMPSPFQMELAAEIDRRPGLSFWAGFTGAGAKRRGDHWRRRSTQDNIFVAAPSLNGLRRADWIRNLVRRLRPEVVLVGGYRGSHYYGALLGALPSAIPHGFWLEVPNLLAPRYRQLILSKELHLRFAGARFILAIGDRAAAFYRNYCANLALVPYGQDLSRCFAGKRPARPPEAPLRFLFSGQLIKRHNISMMLEAAANVVRLRGASFRLVLAAHGPEQATVDAVLSREGALQETLEYDRDYECWSDRLRPFFNCDVLLYPSAHSGWGLVIPEAMASGVMPISTRNVEAARHYITHQENGLLITPTKENVVRAMIACIDDREMVRRMAAQARERARAGTVECVADRMIVALQRFCGG